MKQHLKILLILVAILSIGSIVYFVMNFLKKKKGPENFENSNEEIKRNEENINIFKKISKEDAAKYGISQETYTAMMGVFNNNGTIDSFADICSRQPEQASAVGKFMADNSN
jgi:cell division protein YceG involved in septum cleavage